ncbi:pancreatic progenitor cell differentiation and proliferation factor-like [Podarcis raffonei]|uniref:pancreatic progenitor cell differentiation and proliferation factor-like n=1 Tax=Podarcis raffonei TaxID=65483 RepID=UPI0023299DB2|nr:pancreatic progenitor cell differentiation and proliferation factor-like [Podarcis raffonei]
MAAVPPSGCLVATHDCYQRRLCSTSSNSSCGSAEYGEDIPHHPGFPKSDPGHSRVLHQVTSLQHPAPTGASKPTSKGTLH